MKFHVVITDNETGTVLSEKDADAIVASIHSEETTTQTVLTSCSSDALTMTMAVLLKLVKLLKKENPEEYRIAKKHYKKLEKEND